ncbi:MAG: LamG-like jellyroll fold domain-containing protein [Verrucomicrobiota bacterium]
MKPAAITRLVAPLGPLAVCLLAVCLLAALLGAPAQAGTNVVVADDFNDNAIEGSKWTTSNPNSLASSSETGSPNGYITSANRANILTAAAVSWDPADGIHGGQHLTGTFFMAADSYRGQGDIVNIYTRSSNANNGGGAISTKYGVEFGLGEGTHTLSLNVPGYTNTWTQAPVATGDTFFGGTNYQQCFSFDVWDFGDGRYAGTFTQMAGANAGMTSSVTAISSTTGSYPGQVNQVNMHSREKSNNYSFSHQTNFDDVVIAAPSSWAGTGGSSWSGTNWSGGNKVDTNPTGNGVAVVFGKAGSVGTVNLDAAATVGAMAFYPNVNTTVTPSNGSVLTLDNRPLPGTTDTGALAAITVLGGTHSITSNITLATGALVVVFNSADVLTLGGNLNGTGYDSLATLGRTDSVGGNSLTKGGAGTLYLNGSNRYSGNTYVSTGTVSIAGTGSLPGWDTSDRYRVSNAAALAVQNAVSDADVITMLDTNNFAYGAILGFDTAAGNRTYPNAIEDTFNGMLGLAKIGANKLTLPAASTYTGPTRVSAGTLQVDGSLTGGGAVTVPAGGTLNVSGGASVTGHVLLSGGALNLAGTLTTSTGPTLSLWGSTLTTTGAGANIFNADFSAASAGTTVNAGTYPLQIVSHAQFVNNTAVDLTGAGAFSLSGADVLNPGSASHRVLTASGGTVTVTGGSAFPPAGLQGMWSFDDGTANDSSGNAHHGTMVNNPVFSTDTHTGYGRSLLLNGTNYVTVDTGGSQTVFDGGNTMTVSAWVKGSPGDSNAYISKNGESNGWQMRYRDTYRSMWTTRGGTSGHGDMDGNLATNVYSGWHMLTMTYDGANKSIYIDGVLDSKTQAATGTISPSSDLLAFGAKLLGGSVASPCFSGLLDDICFYNRALGLSEVLAIYTSTASGNLDWSTTDLAVTATSSVALGTGVTRFGNLALSGAGTQVTIGGSGATGVSFSNISAAATSSIAAGLPLTLLTGDVTVADTKTLTVNSSIIDGLGVAALNKLGTGTLVLAGTNTYTGDIHVNAGGLVLAAGTGMKFVVTNASSNKISGAGSVTLDGSFTLDISSVTAAAGSWLLVDVSNKLFGAGFMVAGAGWSKDSNVWLKTDAIDPTLTWTFSEATGILTLRGPITTVASFSGLTASQSHPAGTASVTLSGTVTGDGPVYPVNGEPLTITINGVTQATTINGGVGWFTFDFPTAAIPASATPYPITYSYAGNLLTLSAAPDDTSTTLTLSSDYSSWIASKGLADNAALPAADPDHDGVSNIIEFVLGGEPNPATSGSNSRSLLPVVARNANGDMLFTFHRKILSIIAARLTFQWSTALSFASANNVPVGAMSSATGGVAVVVNSLDATTDTIVISVPATKAAGGKLFARLAVTAQ